MLLSQITNKPIRSGKTQRGVCVGVGISLKSRAVKYLLCSSFSPSLLYPSPHEEKNAPYAPLEEDFSIGVQAIENLDGEEITLSRLRAQNPKNNGKLFIGKPIYTDEGVFLGRLADAHLQNFIITELKTDKNITYSALTIAACSDALILRKEQPFPIGQRIPAPFVFDFLTENDVVTTKSILRTATQKGQLIHFTLSLPPFCLDITPTIKKHRFF